MNAESGDVLPEMIVDVSRDPASLLVLDGRAIREHRGDRLIEFS